jgi:hypothetical protein
MDFKIDYLLLSRLVVAFGFIGLLLHIDLQEKCLVLSEKPGLDLSC